MYVLITMLMFQGQHQVIVNQALFPNEEMCEVIRQEIMIKLENTKPDPSAVAILKCVDMSVTKSKGIDV